MTKNKKTQNQEDHASHKILMRQMQEEARMEKISNFLQKNKKPIISSLILLVVIILSITIYQSVLNSKNKEYSKLMHQALVFENEGQINKAQEIFEDIREASSVPAKIRSLALLKYGSILVSKNETKKAVEVFMEANNIELSDPYLTELAGLLMLKTINDGGIRDLYHRFSEELPRIRKESNILKPFILEQEGIFQLEIEGYYEAKKIFESLIIDPKAPDYLKKRAKEFLNSIPQPRR